MHYIFFSILCSVAIANLLMLYGKLHSTGQGDVRLSMLPVFLGNYFIAALFSFIAVPPGEFYLSGFDMCLGIATGALFLANFWVYQRNIVQNGLSISVSVMRVAMIIPVLVALLIFKEKLSYINLAGIALALLAFVLKPRHGNISNIMWLLLLFVVSGLSDLSLKLFKELGTGSETLWIGLIFGSALVFTMLLLLYYKVRISLAALLIGFILGIPNRLSTVFFMKGLLTVPAAIAYPLTASGIVLVSVFSDAILWKRIPARQEVAMYALLALSLALLNM